MRFIATRAGYYNCPEEGCTYKSKSPYQTAGHYGAQHRRFAEPTEIEHGTVSGYAKHLRREGPGFKCEEGCREAKAKYELEYRQRRKAAGTDRAKKDGKTDARNKAA